MTKRFRTRPLSTAQVRSHYTIESSSSSSSQIRNYTHTGIHTPEQLKKPRVTCNHCSHSFLQNVTRMSDHLIQGLGNAPPCPQFQTFCIQRGIDLQIPQQEEEELISDQIALVTKQLGMPSAWIEMPSVRQLFAMVKPDFECPSGRDIATRIQELEELERLRRESNSQIFTKNRVQAQSCDRNHMTHPGDHFRAHDHKGHHLNGEMQMNGVTHTANPEPPTTMIGAVGSPDNVKPISGLVDQGSFHTNSQQALVD